MIDKRSCQDCWSCLIGPEKLCRCRYNHWTMVQWKNIVHMHRACEQFEEHEEGERLSSKLRAEIEEIEAGLREP